MAERQEKLFILTGASRGLGRALAEQLLREAGCTLLTLSRQPLAAHCMTAARCPATATGQTQPAPALPHRSCSAARSPPVKKSPAVCESPICTMRKTSARPWRRLRSLSIHGWRAGPKFSSQSRRSGAAEAAGCAATGGRHANAAQLMTWRRFMTRPASRPKLAAQVDETLANPVS